MRAPSLLTIDSVKDIVRDRYGLECKAVTKIEGGNTSHLYKLGTAGGFFVLKESSPSFTLKQVLAEAHVLKKLAESEIPVAPFIPTTTGELAWVLQDRPFHLQPFIEGEVVAQCTAPLWLQNASAALLGKIQVALHEVEVPHKKFDEGWFLSRKNPEKGIKKYDSLIELAEKLDDAELRNTILEELAYKKTSGS